MLVQVKIILISLSLGGCFYMPVVSKGKVSTLDEAPRMAATVSSTESKSIAAYDPASKVATTIPAPSGALSGSSVTLPAGALSIAAELVVEEAVPLSQTSVAGSLNISADITVKPVGSGLIIRPTQDVDLTKPLTIAMPINPTAGLHTWLSRVLALNADTHYTVFYKYFVNGELKAGAIPSSVLRFSDSGSVLFEGYFGAYWLAEVSAPIQEKLEIKTDEPIINKDNVAVATHTGMVTETEILAKAAVPSVEWLSVSLSLHTSQRAVKASATIAAGRSLSSCHVDLFDNTSANSGIDIDVGSTLSTDYKVTRLDAHNLYARFRCLDDEGRLAISPWSAPVSLIASAPVSTKPALDFCSSTPPGLHFFLGTGTGPLAKAKPFTAQGSCVYKLDVDTMGDFNFGIQTADGALSCSASTIKLGEQTLTCGSSSTTPQTMTLPQGNYTFTLDFSADAAQPKLLVALQACHLGDMHLLTDSVSMWPDPDSSNRMQHLGGCQYAMQTTRVGGALVRLRLSNSNGSYVCTDMGMPYIYSGKPLVLNCGTPIANDNSYYMLDNSSTFASTNKYLVNLGSNLDTRGNPTSVPFIHFTQDDPCMDNLYLLGPTAAGMSRVPGVNSFKKDTACIYKFQWLNNGPLLPFFIGRGEGTEKCGMTTSPAATPSTSLDCSATALAIDMQDKTFLGLTAKVLDFNVHFDPATGKFVSINVMPGIDPMCHDTYYAAKSLTSGYFFDANRVLTEVQPCLYEYDWTPTAQDRGFMLIPTGNSASTSRYGVYLGFSQPVVGGPAVDITAFPTTAPTNAAMSKYDFPIRPWGIVDGQRYKVSLDLRFGKEHPKLGIVSHSPVNCPDFYVMGLEWAGKTAANRLTRVGDCNYALNFRSTADGTNFHIEDSSGSIKCGVNSIPNNPMSAMPSVPLICSSGSYTPFSVGIAHSMSYQIRIHYDGSGNSNIALQQYYQSCTSPELAGPAADAYAGSKYFMMVNSEMCLQELYWTPTSTSNVFRIKEMMAPAIYCGLKAGAAQLSLSGVETEAICNISNASGVIDFKVAEGFVPNLTYRILLDRRNPFAPPRISITQSAPP